MKHLFVVIIMYGGTVSEVRVFDNIPNMNEYIDNFGDELIKDNITQIKLEKGLDYDTGHIIYTTELNDVGQGTRFAEIPMEVQRSD